jgi:dTDP-4-amino-4,6-dideoxygalactose transaminase
VFGNPCHIEEIDRIAKKHNLKVIYDAAHCFGVQYKGKSIFEYGDISTCSFHATKIFHTGEGGAVFCKDPEIFHKIYYSHNFGHNGPNSFHGLGINGKISELHCAMGLAVLPYMRDILESRKSTVYLYSNLIKHLNIKSLIIRDETIWNYSYFPVIFENEKILTRVENALKIEGIFARRYFYPSLNELNYVLFKKAEKSEEISKKILCLPLYNSILNTEVERIIFILKNILC